MATLNEMLATVRVGPMLPFSGENDRGQAVPILRDAHALLTALESGWRSEADAPIGVDHLATLNPEIHANALSAVGHLIALATAIVEG